MTMPAIGESEMALLQILARKLIASPFRSFSNTRISWIIQALKSSKITWSTQLFWIFELAWEFYYFWSTRSFSKIFSGLNIWIILANDA
jgi:hypothetical protein